MDAEEIERAFRERQELREHCRIQDRALREAHEESARLRTRVNALARERNKLARRAVDAGDDYTRLRQEYVEHRRACGRSLTAEILKRAAAQRLIKDLRVELRLLKKEAGHR